MKKEKKKKKRNIAPLNDLTMSNNILNSMFFQTCNNFKVVQMFLSLILIRLIANKKTEGIPHRRVKKSVLCLKLEMS